MTASPARRRRNTWIALGATAIAVVVAAALGGVAAVSLSNSTAGRNAADELEWTDTVQRLPWTATALIGVVDDDNTLTSVVVAVISPAGTGGTMVSISPSSDAAAATADVVRPLNSIFEVDGPEAWYSSVEQLSGLSFDVAEVVDQERFGELITPLGDLPAAFPFGFTDANSGETFESGSVTLSAPSAGRAVTARNAGGPSWQLDAVRDAVWQAAADGVGDGLGSLLDGVRYDQSRPPTTLDEFTAALFAAPVDFRALSTFELDTDRVAEQMPDDHAEALWPDATHAVVAVDRAEVAMVMGSIAPGRMGAPADGPVVRLVSALTDDDVAPLEGNRSDVIEEAVDGLLFSQANVVSVVDLPGSGVPDRTRIEVADPAMIDGVWAAYDDLFGDMQVVPADVRVEGVDLVVILGRNYLDVVAAGGGMADDEGDGDVAVNDDDNGDDQEGDDVQGSGA